MNRIEHKTLARATVSGNGYIKKIVRQKIEQISQHFRDHLFSNYDVCIFQANALKTSFENVRKLAGLRKL